MASNVVPVYVLCGVILAAVVGFAVLHLSYENSIENLIKNLSTQQLQPQTPPAISFNFPSGGLSYPVNSTATVSIMDRTVNSDTSKRASITVNVTSTSDSHGILLKMYQKQKGSSEFVTAPFKIVLTSLATDNSVKWLHVEAGDTMFVTYKGQTVTANISPAISLQKVITRGIPLGSTTTIYGDSPDGMNMTQYPIDRSTVPSCIYETSYDGICGDWIDGTWGTQGMLSIPYGNVIYQLQCDQSTLDAPDQYGVPDCPDQTGNYKDVYVEIQYMSKAPGASNYIKQRPTVDELTKVAAAFLSHNIRVHFQVDDSLDRPSSSPCGLTTPPSCHIYYDLTTVPGSINDPPGTHSFFSIKNSYFGTMGDRSCDSTGNNQYIPPCGPNGPSDPQTINNIHDWLSAKREAFHYALFIHSQGLPNEGSSGWGEIWGNDMVISMGAFTNGVGAPQEVEGTLMHELGHNLNLDHGGPVNTGTGPTPGQPNIDYATNCKPNEKSVMNYLYQLPYFAAGWTPDYSQSANTLDENNPSENVLGSGIGANTITFGGMGVSPATGPNSYGGHIDWDRDNGNVVSPNNPAYLDLIQISGCKDNTQLAPLYSYDEWSSLNMYFWDSYNYANGMSANPEASHSDMTYRDMIELASQMYKCPRGVSLSSIDPGQDIGNLLMKNQCTINTTYTPNSLPTNSSTYQLSGVTTPPGGTVKLATP